MYAFARDGGLPGHKFFHNVDKKRKSPIRTGKQFFVRILQSISHLPFKYGWRALLASFLDSLV